MLAAALLSVALVTQAPKTTAPPANPAEVQAPAPPVDPRLAPDNEFRRTLDRRKALAAKKRGAAAVKAMREMEIRDRERQAWGDYMAKVGPLLAEQQRLQWQQQRQTAQLQMEARRTAAMEAAARAEQQNATTNQQRLWIEQQQLQNRPYYPR